MQIKNPNWKIFFIICLFFPFTAYAGGYVLKNKLINPNPDQKAPVVEFNADDSGGNITYHVVYNSSCQGTYQMTWAFSKDIRQLADGEDFSVNLQCTSCQDVCGYRWNTGKGSAGGTNNLLSIPGVKDYVYNGNFSRTDSSSDVQAWYPDTFSETYDFSVKLLKDAPDSGFYLTLGSHQIIYHYGQVESATCQNASIKSNLDIQIPSLDFNSINGNINFWLNLEFKGQDKDGDYIWKLKNIEEN